MINFKNNEKIVLMIALVVLAYTFSVLEGLKKKQVRDLKKKYKDGSCYSAISVFREGLAIVTAYIASLPKLWKYWINKMKPKPHLIYQNV